MFVPDVIVVFQTLYPSSQALFVLLKYLRDCRHRLERHGLADRRRESRRHFGQHRGDRLAGCHRDRGIGHVGAMIAAAEAADIAQIVVGLGTSADVAATESADAAALTAEVTTGADITATDYADSAAITASSGGTLAVIDVAEASDVARLTALGIVANASGWRADLRAASRRRREAAHELNAQTEIRIRGRHGIATHRRRGD